MNNLLCSTLLFAGATTAIGFDNDSVSVQPLPAEQKPFVLYCQDRVVQVDGCSTRLKGNSLIVECE